MTRIEMLEKVENEGLRYSAVGANPTFGAAYFYSKEAGNDFINFADVIWDYDIDPILADCRKFGITEFTISSTFSSLIKTIAEFEKRGCKLQGVTEINGICNDWELAIRGIKQKEKLPAFKMSL